MSHIAKHTNYYGFHLHGMCLNVSNETYYVGKNNILECIKKHIYNGSICSICLLNIWQCILIAYLRTLAVFMKSLEPVIAFSYCEIGAGLKLFIFCWGGGGGVAQCAPMCPTVAAPHPNQRLGIWGVAPAQAVQIIVPPSGPLKVQQLDPRSFCNWVSCAGLSRRGLAVTDQSQAPVVSPQNVNTNNAKKLLALHVRQVLSSPGVGSMDKGVCEPAVNITVLGLVII